MKFDWLDESDKDVRYVLKTYPWVALIIICFIGFILFSTLSQQSVSMRDGYSPIDYKIVYLSQEDHPIFFFLIVALELLIIFICSAYSLIRLQIRSRLIKEDR